MPALIQSLPDNFRVDFTEVKVANSATLILMLALKRQAQQMYKAVNFVHFPPSMNRIIKLAELEKLLY